jgi:hypothetical protein
MKNTADPSVHRQRERQFIEHVERLLVDPRLRPETVNGAKPITTLMPRAGRSDRAMDLKNEMVRRGSSDRDLQNRMPSGEQIDVALSTKKWLIFRRPVGRMRVVCISPTSSLLAGEESKPMSQQEVTRLIGSQPPPLGGVPTTLVVMATHGFALEAHEVTDRRPDRTVILVEPNDAGGWSVYGPPEQKALVDLFDPEADQEKRSRVRQAIAADQTELLTGGLSADRIATRAQLPLQLVESELKSYAKQNPGLQAKRLDGHVVLFREGSAPVSSGSAGATGAAAGGGEANMPLIDRIKSLFARKGENEKKIAVLSEQKAAFAQQLDRSYEEIGALEKKEQQLRDDFKANTSALTRRRITGQMLQLRKDIERRQQLVGVLNQRVNVVSTHLHNLELVRQGNTTKLPDAEELANDAAAAEEMLAELQASSELADGVGSGIATSGMSEEEQALYAELEREAGGGTTSAGAADASAPPERSTQTSRTPASPARAPTRAAADAPKRAEPEAG